MYEAYWGLHIAPFDNTPDPRFLYASTQHEEALARLQYLAERNKGAVLLTGVFGCGKTLLAQAFLAGLPEGRFRSAYLANPLMSGVELLHGIARKLHVPNVPDRRSDVLVDDLLAGIETVLRENARDGKATVLIVDEAHVIRDEQVIEHLRLLMNYQDQERFLLKMVLMGQPELRELVDHHKPLAQRIAVGCHLEPLSPHDTAAYIQHRLRVAGAARDDLFDARALDLLYQYSGGIPRRINQLGDLVMIGGMAQRVTQIGEAVVKDAAASVGV